MEITKILSKRIFKIKDLSENDISQLKKLFLDFFAAAYAGYKQNKVFNEAVKKVIFSQEGTQDASILFCKKKYPARTAAFMNALYGHGAELDDGNRKAMGHVGVHVIPAVLALAESEKKTEKDILIALAAGYETYIRVSASVQPGMVQRGFHSTGMAGTIASAAACAKLLDFDAEGIENAISLASTMSSGLLSYGESRQMIKPLNPAKAAETGVFAAQLVKSGIKGPLNSLEGPNGWFHAVSEQYDESMILGEMGGKLLLHECYIKMYPSCRHTHCGIEAAINIHNNVEYERIKEVNVRIYPNAIKLAGQIRFPKDSDETKFSIYYTLACGLIHGKYGIDDMNPEQADPEVTKMIDKIKLIPDDTMENREKGIRGTTVKVILEDGSEFEDTVLIPKGDPENPFSFEDVIKKLYICSNGMADMEEINYLVQYVSDFGKEEIFGLFENWRKNFGYGEEC